MTEAGPPEFDAREQWRENRTTFQRVYDVLAGTDEPASAAKFAEWADCSENGARRALEQLNEMGIAERTATRPVTYRRNPSYFRWKRIEALAEERSPGELRARIDELVEEDRSFQEKYNVPHPDAVVVEEAADDHERLHEQWEHLAEWRSIRRDIEILTQAVQRAESSADDRARA